MTPFPRNWLQSKWNAPAKSWRASTAREHTAWVEMPTIVWLLKQLECLQIAQAVHPSRRAHFPVHTSNMVLKENRQKDQRCKWTKEFLQTPGQELTKHISAVPILAQQDLIIAIGKWLLCVSLYSLFWMRFLIEVLLFFLHWCLMCVGKEQITYLLVYRSPKYQEPHTVLMERISHHSEIWCFKSNHWM